MSNYWPVMRALRECTFLIEGKEYAMQKNKTGSSQFIIKSTCEYCGCDFSRRWNKSQNGGDLGYYSGRHCSAACRRFHEEEGDE